MDLKSCLADFVIGGVFLGNFVIEKGEGKIGMSVGRKKGKKSEVGIGG